MAIDAIGQAGHLVVAARSVFVEVIPRDEIPTADSVDNVAVYRRAASTDKAVTAHRRPHPATNDQATPLDRIA